MLIKIKYDSSEGPHIMHVSADDIRESKKDNPYALHIRSEDPAKTLTIHGTADEFAALSNLVQAFY